MAAFVGRLGLRRSGLGGVSNSPVPARGVRTTWRLEPAVMVVGVLVIAEVDVEVDEAHPRLAVAVPVEGAVEAQPCRRHSNHRDQHRAEPSAGAADQQPEASQGHPTIVAFR